MWASKRAAVKHSAFVRHALTLAEPGYPKRLAAGCRMAGHVRFAQESGQKEPAKRMSSKGQKLTNAKDVSTFAGQGSKQLIR